MAKLDWVKPYTPPPPPPPPAEPAGPGFGCPKCGGLKLTCYQARRKGRSIRRIRRCKACGHRFSTSEKAVN